MQFECTHVLWRFALKRAQLHEHMDVVEPLLFDWTSWPSYPLKMDPFAVMTSPSNLTATCKAWKLFTKPPLLVIKIYKCTVTCTYVCISY